MKKIRLVESLKEILGFHIGIYTNDGEHIEGILTEIKGDFLIIKDEKDKTFFFNIDKIQAFSKNTRKFKVDDSPSEPFYERSLMEVIDNYQYCWVTVHCQHKLTFSGILTVITNDHIILTVKDEKLYIQKEHIITFQPEKLKPSRKPQEEEKKKEEDKKKDKKDDNKDKKDDKKDNKKNNKRDNKKNDDKDQKKGNKKDKKERNKDYKKDNSSKQKDKSQKDNKSDKRKEQDSKENKTSKDYSRNNNTNGKRDVVSTAFKKVIKNHMDSLDTPLINQISNHLKTSLADAADDKDSPKEKGQSKNKSVSTTEPNDKTASNSNKGQGNNEKRSSNGGSKGGLITKTYYGISFREKNRKRKSNYL